MIAPFPLRIEVMGRVPYRPMLALQEQRHAEVKAGVAEDTLFLLEHEPVLTTGKNRGAEHVLASMLTLAARGIEVVETSRGGDVTYHGPGQLVGYPIVKLRPGEQDIRRYVERLEEILIRTAADFGVLATRVEGLRGIWVGDSKLAAVGVRIAEWTTLHGFALNVEPQPDGFALIVPCGLHGRGVTSLAQLLGTAPCMEEVRTRVAHHAGAVLRRQEIYV
ncbi:MAG: lipoyl(octanoyl) transferase LipB [Myxococcota bacterium]